MQNKTPPRAPSQAVDTDWIETAQRLVKGSYFSHSFCVDGLEIALNSVDPGLVRWVVRYLQPLSAGYGAPRSETCSFYCLNDDDLVVEASRYFENDSNIDVLGHDRYGATLKCAEIADDLRLYCNGSEGILWLADFQSKTMSMIFASRTKRPAVAFCKMVREIITSHLRDNGWFLYHAGAVQTSKGVLMIVGRSGAGKTTLVLGLLRHGARYIANELLYVRPDGDGFEILACPMTVAIGLGTALQFQALSDLVESPDQLLCPRLRFSASRVQQTPREDWPSLDDKLQLLPEEIDQHVGSSSGLVIGGRLHAIVVPRVSKQPIAPHVDALDEDTTYDILADNLLVPQRRLSDFAMTRMVEKHQRSVDEEDALLDRLCTVDAVRFDYSLSTSHEAASTMNLLLESAGCKRST